MKIGIIGLGLIGGSIGRALIAKTNHTVYGYDIDPVTMEKAILLRAMQDELTEDKIKECDIVVLALNPQQAIEYMPKVCKLSKPGTIITDICGNKRDVIKKMEELKKQYEDIEFIGVHPMAGREFSGIEHSMATLFEHSFAIVIPVHATITAIETIKNLYKDIGCEGITYSTAEKHDNIIAYTSQLAHIVSIAYVKNENALNHAGYSAGSFRDMTRVARMNPEMWAQLFIENKDNLIGEIDILQKNIEELKQAIIKQDKDELKGLLQEGVDLKAKSEDALKERRKNERN